MLPRTRCEAIGAMRTSQKSEIFVESDELKDRVLPCSYSVSLDTVVEGGRE
jgi:hypothetical protein